jgi:putative SbcD/Mre11-related phosphoesterase
MSFRFITNYPALFITEKKMLVISDLHIGLEYELLKSGIKIRKQIEKFKNIIDDLVKLTKASTLLIIGDVKYKVPGMSLQELKDIPKFFDYLNDNFKKVIVTKGNHDDFLETILHKKVKIYSSRGVKLGEYGFFHGHAWPSKALMKCDYLLMGHLQPAVEFRDKLGYRSIQQVWLKGKLNQELIKKKYEIKKTGKLNFIVLPSFNKISGSLVVNKVLKKELIGPLLANKILDIDKTKSYLLDGTYLGEIKNLKIKLF